jgi:hypothetical protein
MSGAWGIAELAAPQGSIAATELWLSAEAFRTIAAYGPSFQRSAISPGETACPRTVASAERFFTFHPKMLAGAETSALA